MKVHAYEKIDMFSFDSCSTTRYLITYEVEELLKDIEICNNCKVIKIEDLSRSVELNSLIHFKTKRNNDLSFRQEKEEYIINNIYHNKVLFKNIEDVLLI